MTTPAKTHRVAFYGSLRKGEYNYRPEQGEPICVGKITNAELVGGNAYPWVVASDDASRSVVVEVYDIPDSLYQRIHNMELSAGYEAKEVEVEYSIAGPEHDIDHTDDPIKATVYFYANPARLASKPRIASGDWTKRDKDTNS